MASFDIVRPYPSSGVSKLPRSHGFLDQNPVRIHCIVINVLIIIASAKVSDLYNPRQYLNWLN
jgi:hypothetical protein